MHRWLDDTLDRQIHTGTTGAHSRKVQRDLIGLDRDEVNLTLIGPHKRRDHFATNLQQLVDVRRHRLRLSPRTTLARSGLQTHSVLPIEKTIATFGALNRRSIERRAVCRTSVTTCGVAVIANFAAIKDSIATSGNRAIETTSRRSRERRDLDRLGHGQRRLRFVPVDPRPVVDPAGERRSDRDGVIARERERTKSPTIRVVLHVPVSVHGRRRRFGQFTSIVIRNENHHRVGQTRNGPVHRRLRLVLPRRVEIDSVMENEAQIAGGQIAVEKDATARKNFVPRMRAA